MARAAADARRIEIPIATHVKDDKIYLKALSPLPDMNRFIQLCQLPVRVCVCVCGNVLGWSIILHLLTRHQERCQQLALALALESSTAGIVIIIIIIIFIDVDMVAPAFAWLVMDPTPSPLPPPSPLAALSLCRVLLMVSVQR